jgi:hypothetical protein
MKIFWNTGWTKSGESWYNFSSECKERKERVYLLSNTETRLRKCPLAFKARSNTELQLFYSLLIHRNASLVLVHWKGLVFRHWRRRPKLTDIMTISVQRKEISYFPVTNISNRSFFKVCSQPGETLKDKKIPSALLLIQAVHNNESDTKFQNS